jgi:adenylylsulfate kinase-like enzyme
MVILITGRPNAGKTTFARKLLRKYDDAVLLDGDELREVFKYKAHSKRGKTKWMMSIARLAALLESQGYRPIIALVSPYRRTRKKMMKFFKKGRLIYIDGTDKYMWEGSVYEVPEEDENPIVVKGNYE